MFCSHCGSEVNDEAVVCVHCGCAVTPQKIQQTGANKVEVSGLKKAAQILMIIGTVAMGIWLIPLIWCIPMICSYNSKIEKGEPISVGFKVCILLFVSCIGGILLLCDKD